MRSQDVSVKEHLGGVDRRHLYIIILRRLVEMGCSWNGFIEDEERAGLAYLDTQFSTEHTQGFGRTTHQTLVPFSYNEFECITI